MLQIENLIEDEEVDSIAEKLEVLKKSSRGLIDRWFFWGVNSSYRSLRKMIKKLNEKTDRFNFEEEQFPSHDSGGKVRDEIFKGKREVAEEAQRIFQSLRRYVIDNKLKEKYGISFTKVVEQYRKVAVPFQQYLWQETMGPSAKPASGMVRVDRIRIRGM